MDPSEMIAPIFGIAAAAAITFYSVSFMQMSDKSFEDLGDREEEPPVLRSSQSSKEKRNARSALKDQQQKMSDNP